MKRVLVSNEGSLKLKKDCLFSVLLGAFLFCYVVRPDVVDLVFGDDAEVNV